MERLTSDKPAKKHSFQERLAVKSLPLVSILVDSPQAISEIQNGHIAQAIVGSAFAAGIGFAGSHLILNDGLKIKESWQEIKDWGHDKHESAKRLFPSKKRTIIASAVAALGALAVGNGIAQVAQGDFSEARNAISAGIGLEGIAGLNLLQPHLKRKRELELSQLGDVANQQTDALGQREEFQQTELHAEEAFPLFLPNEHSENG